MRAIELNWIPLHQAEPRFERDQSQRAFEELKAGFERFRLQRPMQQTYHEHQLSELAQSQSPIAAMVTCSDSRVSPEIIFDQPLGKIFASRVPGNVASDSAKWMLEIAIGSLQVPLVFVMGHIGCLAISQIISGVVGPGGHLRDDVYEAVLRVKGREYKDIFSESVEENVLLTIEKLRLDNHDFAQAIQSGSVAVIGAVYDMQTGEVRIATPDSNT